jgi:glycine oxidase
VLEVVVVGGGIAGAAVALELLERGVAVNVVDAERPGGAATGAAAGMLAPQYESSGATPLFRLLVEARSGYPEFAARLERLAGRDVGLRWDGMLVVNLTAAEEAAAEETVRWQRGEGYPAELLEVGEARRMEPGLGPEVRSCVWLPAEGQVDAQRLALALPDALGAAGARLVTGRRAVELTASAGRVTGVRLADGRALPADGVVLAAGAWSGGLAGLPRPLPVRPVRGHILRFPAPAGGMVHIVSTHGGRYLVPKGDDTVLAGSTMDDVGFDRSLSEEGMAAVHATAARLVPALGGAEPVERWADLRPISGDRLPILGPDPDLEGLFYATGYGRNGILLGALAGRMVAELVTTGETRPDWRPFGIHRFLAAGGGG